MAPVSTFLGFLTCRRGRLWIYRTVHPGCRCNGVLTTQWRPLLPGERPTASHLNSMAFFLFCVSGAQGEDCWFSPTLPLPWLLWACALVPEPLGSCRTVLKSAVLRSALGRAVAAVGGRKMEFPVSWDLHPKAAWKRGLVTVHRVGGVFLTGGAGKYQLLGSNPLPAPSCVISCRCLYLSERPSPHASPAGVE